MINLLTAAMIATTSVNVDYLAPIIHMILFKEETERDANTNTGTCAYLIDGEIVITACDPSMQPGRKLESVPLVES